MNRWSVSLRPCRIGLMEYRVEKLCLMREMPVACVTTLIVNTGVWSVGAMEGVLVMTVMAMGN